MTPTHDAVGIWLAAVCTIAIYSILYRENVLFRLFEHILIGLATGYGAYIVVTQVLHPLWYTPTFEEGRWYDIFALLTGALFYTIFSRRLAWMSRFAMGVLMGLGAGLGIVGFITELAPQLQASFKPLNTINNVMVLVTVLTVMSYFFFSREHGRGLAASSRLGRWLLMVGFGAIFGNTVMARMSLFIDRANFFINDWAPQVKHLALWLWAHLT